MILSVTSSLPTFKSLTGLGTGLNLIVSQRSKGSSSKDSRNGTGKSSLIEIIHFCFGSDQGLLHDKDIDFSGHWFSVTIQLFDSILDIRRFVASPNVILISEQGSPPSLLISGEYSIKDFKSIMGSILFGIDDQMSFSLSFRTLFNYIVRRGQEAYLDPFTYTSKQPAWSRDVHTAFLLDLGYNFATEFHQLKKEEKHIKDLKKALEMEGVLGKSTNALGKLEAAKFLLEPKVVEMREAIRKFSVHPQYKEIQDEADRLTKRISHLKEEIYHNNRLLASYQTDLSGNTDIDIGLLVKMYNEAGVQVGNLIQKTIEEALDFHRRVAKNRYNYLRDEIQKLQSSITASEASIRELDEKREYSMNILRSHGALDEYNLLQEKANAHSQELTSLTYTIERIKTYETKNRDLKRKESELVDLGQRDFDERDDARRLATNEFNSLSEELNKLPGQLIIDWNEKRGFSFDIEIQGSRSDGKKKLLKTFCFDFTIQKILARRQVPSRLLIHDSIMFDGVDGRQIAAALSLAHKKAIESNFTYIVCMNSDDIEKARSEHDFSGEFDIDERVRLSLSDTETGGIFGFRF